MRILLLERNALGNMVKDMCREVGIEQKTNRATGVTAMFQANVPDKIIQKTTEHRSTEALCSYERVSTQQHQAVSQVLMSNQSFEKELEPSKPTLAPIAPALPVQFLEFHRSLAASRAALLEG